MSRSPVAENRAFRRTDRPSHSSSQIRPGISSTAAFTLVELLVVIAIIAILAAMLVPAAILGITHVRVARAKTEMRGLVAGINQYESTYSHFPYVLEGVDAGNDGTFGYGGYSVPGSRAYSTNSDIMMVIMAVDRPGGINERQKRNPQRQSFFSGRSVSSTNEAGISTVDYQLRDPWGNPYVITIDLNYDDKCRDAVYGLPSVSQQNGTTGYYGLTDTGNPPSGFFDCVGPVMVWSLGPDGQAASDVKANAGVNKDNVLSWR